jgi:hypothetical protein
VRQLTNFSIRKPIRDGFVEEIEKAHVKSYSRKTKAGAMSQVKEHEDKRHRMQPPTMQKQGMNKSPVQEQQKPEQQQGMEMTPQGKTAPLETELKHLQFMSTRYPHIVDHEKLAARAKIIRDALRSVDETLQSTEFAKHGADAEGKTKKVVDLHEHLANARKKRAENLTAKKKDEKKNGTGKFLPSERKSRIKDLERDLESSRFSLAEKKEFKKQLQTLRDN